jgi:hypothetical protein
MVDFRCREYSDGKVTAEKAIRERIVEIGIREMVRLTGIHSDTITLIANGKPVKPKTLAKVVGFLQVHRTARAISIKKRGKKRLGA